MTSNVTSRFQAWLLRDSNVTSDELEVEKLNDVDLKAGSKETFLIQVHDC